MKYKMLALAHLFLHIKLQILLRNSFVYLQPDNPLPSSYSHLFVYLNKETMVKNIVSILLVAVFFLCNMAFADRAIVMSSNECIILDGNGKEVIVSTGNLHTIFTSGKIELIGGHYRHRWHF